MDVPPVVRGEFHCRDALFVECSGKQHARASEEELKPLPNGKAAKDEVGHWYEAQLIHYGLPRSKEKNTAKMRLQQALSQGKLKVPPHLVDMEAQMKKEYASAVRKAKSASKSGAEAGADKPAPKAQKRKNDQTETEGESSKRTKISVTVGDVSFNIDHSDAHSAKQKTTTKTPKVPSKKSASQDTGAGAESSKPKAGESKGKAHAKAAKDDKSAPPPAAKPKKSISKTTSTSDEQVESLATPNGSTKKGAEVKAADAESRPKSKVKSEPKIKSEPKAKAKPKAKPKPKAKSEPAIKEEASDNTSQLAAAPTFNVSGVYDITYQQPDEYYRDQTGRLRLLLSKDKDSIWGDFELDTRVGVIRVDHFDLDSTMSFGWRAKDRYENGGLTFGQGCFGDLEFTGSGQIRGSIYNRNREPMTFEVWRRAGPKSQCGRSAESFEEEWEEYPREAYGR